MCNTHHTPVGVSQPIQLDFNVNLIILQFVVKSLGHILFGSTVQRCILVFSGGCATFGHSCYGGMGKRASLQQPNTGEILQDVQNLQNDENPAFVFTGPRSEFKPERAQRLAPQQLDDISQVIRQWVKKLKC